MNREGNYHKGGISQVWLIHAYTDYYDYSSRPSVSDVFLNIDSTPFWKTSVYQTSTLTSVSEVSEHGVFFTHEIRLTFAKNDLELSSYLSSYAEIPLIAIVLDNNGNYFLVGNADASLRMTTAKQDFGTRTSFNQREVLLRVRSRAEIVSLKPN